VIRKYERQSNRVRKIFLEETIQYQDRENLFDLGQSTAEMVDFDTIKSNRSKSKKSNRSGKSTSQRKSKRRKLGKIWLKVNFKGLNFNFTSVLMTLTVGTLMLVLVQLIYYLSLKPGATRVTNFTKIFILGAETWSAYTNLNTFFLATVLWNNSLPSWGGMKPLDVYKFMRTHIKERIILNYTESLNYDLGNYTDKFREIYTSVSKKKIF